MGWTSLVSARPPKAITLPAAIADREHHAVAEEIVGDRDALAVGEQARLLHHLGVAVLAREKVAQGETLGLRKAEPEFLLRLLRDAAFGEIGPRPGPGGAVQRRWKKPAASSRASRWVARFFSAAALSGVSPAG